MRLLVYKLTHTTTRDGQLITVGPILLLDFISAIIYARIFNKKTVKFAMEYRCRL